MAPLSLHLRFQAARVRTESTFRSANCWRASVSCALDLVAGLLTPLVGLLPFRNQLAQGLELRGGHVHVDRSLDGITLKQPKFAREHDAQAGFELRFKLSVAFGLGGLALQGIDLAGDFLQDVVDARQILLGAFELGFRQGASAS